MPEHPVPPKAAGSLGRKIGPLPLWAWLAVGAVVAFFVYKRSGGGSASTPSATGGSAVTADGSAPTALPVDYGSATGSGAVDTAAAATPASDASMTPGTDSGSGTPYFSFPDVLKVQLVTPHSKKKTAATAHASHHVARAHHASSHTKAKPRKRKAKR